MDQNENNEPRHISALVQTIRKQMGVSRDGILLDMTAAYPALRRFLLGGEYGGAHWPTGLVTARFGGGHLLVKLSLRELGVEACYMGTSASQILETIENDLDTEQVCWEHDWQTRKEEERWLRKSVRES